VAGVMRKQLIALATQYKILVFETTLTDYTLSNADEVFLSNSIPTGQLHCHLLEKIRINMTAKRLTNIISTGFSNIFGFSFSVSMSLKNAPPKKVEDSPERTHTIQCVLYRFAVSIPPVQNAASPAMLQNANQLNISIIFSFHIT